MKMKLIIIFLLLCLKKKKAHLFLRKYQICSYNRNKCRFSAYIHVFQIRQVSIQEILTNRVIPFYSRSSMNNIDNFFQGHFRISLMLSSRLISNKRRSLYLASRMFPILLAQLNSLLFVKLKPSIPKNT